MNTRLKDAHDVFMENWMENGIDYVAAEASAGKTASRPDGGFCSNAVGIQKRSAKKHRIFRQVISANGLMQ
ncbi:MAG: hypothetical protein CML68_05480 [Rhodobacteraceae bacterium]|nr:hypothetical protein [Paracoccaceae bacterium]